MLMQGNQVDILEPFILNSKETVIAFIYSILCNIFSQEFQETIDENQDQLFRRSSVRILYDLLNRIISNCENKTLLVYIAPFYDDRNYLSSYSLYYYGKHFAQSNKCSRLFLFDGGKFVRIDKEETDSVSTHNFCFVGSIVLRPIIGMEVGRTIISPQYLHREDLHDIRKAVYSETMFGIRLKIKGFPFSMQDGETVTCAETTVLNIIDYFAQRYQNYRSVYPDEISQIVKMNSYDRNIPSKGLSYRTISKVLKEIGFFPRLYAAKYDKNLFLENLFCYVSSGIPVALGIDRGNRYEVGHSIVVVGTKKNILEMSEEDIHRLNVFAIPSKKAQITVYTAMIGSNIDEYVVMDDNKPPYTIAKITSKIKWSDWNKSTVYRTKLRYGNNPYDIDAKDYRRSILCPSNEDSYDVSFLLVPLGKEMVLEAAEAIRCFRNILGNHSSKGNGFSYTSYIKDFSQIAPDSNWLIAGDEEENPLLMRVFMCASRSLKKHRYEAMQNNNDELCDKYRKIHMPRFIWVCELYTIPSLKKQACVAEIIIDATTSNSHNSDIANVIVLHYPGMLAYRNPNESEAMLLERIHEPPQDVWKAIKPFSFSNE